MKDEIYVEKMVWKWDAYTRGSIGGNILFVLYSDHTYEEFDFTKCENYTKYAKTTHISHKIKCTKEEAQQYFNDRIKEMRESLT